ncbi:type IV pilus modification PilV family protein [Roseateles violae]|uniref:Pilus assembly protein PilV n=1 Tax=Roseateles violae TaxID=3058042 RepID=A0ABT8DS12_9BURK|nr:pilus assembly protein PilV [Pelomonas sp. PFR6]MDN3921116.1 pilus assembly protein PilV [Pelomonas sp. PFR6]
MKQQIPTPVRQWQRLPRLGGQSGIALIEVLIAVLIFAFGVLGLVGLQASMTQAQTGSKFRADAAVLAADLFGLVQTDNFANLGSYTTAGCPGYARCADWLRKVAANLPGGQATLTTTAASGTVALVISWQQGGQERNSYSSSIQWQQ